MGGHRRLHQSFQPTYEELKPKPKQDTVEVKNRFQPTYEELKPVTSSCGRSSCP